jgi:hypothetical protein
MNAQEKIEKLIAVVKSGKVLHVCTPLRVTLISQSSMDRFDKAGMPLLKAIGDSMYMANGSKYVCIDYCKFITR